MWPMTKGEFLNHILSSHWGLGHLLFSLSTKVRLSRILRKNEPSTCQRALHIIDTAEHSCSLHKITGVH